MKTLVFLKEKKLGEFTENFVSVNSPNLEETIVFLSEGDNIKECIIEKEDWIFEVINQRIEPIRRLYLRNTLSEVIK